MKSQKLRVWWIPQVGAGGNPFYVPVESVPEAKKVMDILSFYDCYQYNHRIKGDYCNTGGLEMWNDKTQEWESWEWISEDGSEYYDDVDEYIDEKHPNLDLNSFTDVLANQVHFD